MKRNGLLCLGKKNTLSNILIYPNSTFFTAKQNTKIEYALKCTFTTYLKYLTNVRGNELKTKR